MESISVFEIIKVGIGPSSSHTMGPWNAAAAFIRIIKRERSIEEVKEVFLEFFGSLAKTGIGHGTDIAGMLGLNGEDFKTINTSKIDEKIDYIKNIKDFLDLLHLLMVLRIEVIYMVLYYKMQLNYVVL